MDVGNQPCAVKWIMEHSNSSKNMVLAADCIVVAVFDSCAESVSSGQSARF